MKEKALLKIAFLCSLAGILLLFLSLDDMQEDETPLYKIDYSKEGDAVMIQGTVKSVSKTNSTIFLDVSSYEQIPVIAFTELPFDIYKGEKVEVRGKISEYGGENEIIADDIRVI